jgi:hypothetical protein
LGIGISLGMAADSASSTKAEVWVLTREELNTRSPYAERPQDKDLVAALYYDYGAAPAAAVTGLGVGQVNELRCYLAGAADSSLLLLGEKAATLKPEDVERLCGEPFERTQEVDGTTHLRFLFSLSDKEQARQNQIELVTSHGLNGDCFAFSIALVPKEL